MKGIDSILQKFYMSKLPKAQGGLNVLIPPDSSRGDISSLPYVKKQVMLSKEELAKNKAFVQQRVASKNAKILADRKRRFAEAEQAKSRPFSAQQLADETQATGDKLRLFPNDPDNVFDEYLNPGVFVGNMASKLGRVPLNIQQGNYQDAIMAFAEPLAAGAFEAVIGNMVNKAAAPYSRQIENAEFQAQRGIRRIVPGYVDRKMAAIDKGNQWTKDWYGNPIIKERYDNWIERANSYITPKEAAYQKKLIDIEPNLLGSMNLDKSYSNRLIGTIARDNYDKLLQQGFFTKGTTSRASNFGSNGTLARYSHGPNDALVDVLHPEFRTGSKNMANTTVHENIHAITKGDDGLTGNARTALRKPFAKGDGNFDKYLRKATEVHARIGELRRQFGLKPEKEVDVNTMNRIMDLGLKGKTSVDKRWFELVEDKPSLRWLFNNAPAVAAPVIGAAMLDQKNNGGPIVDPRGQWAHPGQVTRIPSNQITMQGIPYPVYAKPNIGQGRMMYPGQEYNFGGASYVDEYPMMEEGGENDRPKPKKKKTLILAENDPGLWNDKYNKGKVNPFITEAAGIKKYVNKYFPEEDVEIISTYKDNLNEALKRSDANTRLVTLAHAGQNLFGVPIAEYLQSVSKTPYENCYAGTCYGDEIVEGKIGPTGIDTRNLNNFNVRSGHNSWSGFAPVNRGGEEGFKDSFFRRSINPEIKKLNKEWTDLHMNFGNDAISQEEYVKKRNQLDKKLDGAYKKHTVNQQKATDVKTYNFVPYPARVNKNEFQLMGRIGSYQNGGGLLSRSVTCSNCGWSWKAVEGGHDPLTCHKCGGMVKMQDGGAGPGQIYVSNPNDLRLRAYNDSLRLYNTKGDYLKQFRKSYTPAQKKAFYKAQEANYNHGTIGSKDRIEAIGNVISVDRISPDGSPDYVYEYKKPVQAVKYRAPQPVAPSVQRAAPQPAPAPLRQYSGSPVYSPGVGSGMPSALVGFRSQAGDTTFIQPEDYQRFGVPAYGKQYIESQNTKFANGGYTVTRSSDRKGKTHKVTGPDGTVKYFGDSKLGQHPKDPQRKAAFYARHKSNLAGNPYFRAFARKTWQEGGSIELINKDNNPNYNNQYTQAMETNYEKGGEMIRRANGSYSPRGLWDNVRANKGSGKKPTKEMLQQERKIKAKEMKNGGTNNPGFEALPEYVQAQILSNMGYGGYYNPMMASGGEANGEMALGQMAAVSDKMSKLLKFVRPEQNLDPWIASKLAVMDDSADAIADYMMYGPDAQEMEEEMRNGGYIDYRGKRQMSSTPTWSGNIGYEDGGETLWHANWNDTEPSYESVDPMMEQFNQDVASMPARSIAMNIPVNAPAANKKTTASRSKGSSYSVIDFMNSQGMASDYATRKALAEQLGIKGYRGTADQNMILISALSQGAKSQGSKAVSVSSLSGSADYDMNSSNMLRRSYTASSNPFMFGQMPQRQAGTLEKPAVKTPGAANSATAKKVNAANVQDAEEAMTFAKYKAEDPYFFAEESDPGWVKGIDYPFTMLRDLGARTFYDQDPIAVAELLALGLGSHALKGKTKIEPYYGGQKALPRMPSKALPAPAPPAARVPRGPIPGPSSGGYIKPRVPGQSPRGFEMPDAGLRSMGYPRFAQGGPVIGDEMEVTPEQLEQLRAQGYQFEII